MIMPADRERRPYARFAARPGASGRSPPARAARPSLALSGAATMSLGDLSIIEAMDSPDIWKPWFKRPALWLSWRTFLRALFGLGLTPRDVEVFQRCTGRTVDRSGQGFVEAWMIIGRRGGKSFMLALIACYLAAFRDWQPYLAPGERGTIPIICVDRKQARTVFRYCRALLTQVTVLAPLVERADHDTIELSNGVNIEIMTASYRAIRGYTVPAALCDEIAFWRTEETAANPDAEILDALRPAMATIPNAMLLVASSPYARRGALYEANRKHYGIDGDPCLVWKCDTLAMHDDAQVRAVITRAFDDDPVRAASEYGSDGTIDFRSDLETFVSTDAVNAVVIPGRRELPRVTGIRYIATTDPSGSGADAMTLAITHRDKNGIVILDCLRERRPPFSPEAVVAEFAAVCKSYGITKITGDHWGGEFVREPFRKHGIIYELADKPKSDFYSELLPNHQFRPRRTARPSQVHISALRA